MGSEKGLPLTMIADQYGSDSECDQKGKGGTAFEKKDRKMKGGVINGSDLESDRKGKGDTTLDMKDRKRKGGVIPSEKKKEDKRRKEDDIDYWKRKYSDLKESLGKLEMRHKKLVRDLDDCERENSTLYASFKNKEAECHKLEDELSDLYEKYYDAKQDFKEYTCKFDEFSGKIEGFRSTIGQLEHLVNERHAAKVREYNKVCSEMQDKIAKLEEKSGVIESGKGKEQERLAHLKDQAVKRLEYELNLEKESEGYKSKCIKLEEDLEGYKSKCIKLEEDLEGYKSKCIKLDEDLEGYKSKCIKLEEDYKSKCIKYNELCMRYKKKQEKVISLENKGVCAQLNERIVSLEKDQKVAREREKSDQVRINYLEELLGKKKMESETKLQHQGLDEENPTLGCSAGSRGYGETECVQRGSHNESSCNDKGENGMYERVCSEVDGGTHEAVVAPSTFKEKMMNSAEKNQISAFQDNNNSSQGNQDAHVSDQVCSEMNGATHEAVAAPSIFEEKMMNSAGKNPISVFQDNNNSSQGNQDAHVSDEVYDRSCEEDDTPLSWTHKRKKCSKVVTSDCEEDEQVKVGDLTSENDEEKVAEKAGCESEGDSMGGRLAKRVDVIDISSDSEDEVDKLDW